MNSSSPAPSGAPLGHVLLVDDDPAIRASYSQVLRRRGYTYRTAASALEAQEAIGGEPFDAVLSDICMPGLDGLGLLRLLRGRGNPVSFVFMTGRPQTQHAIDAIELGAAHFLLKPMDIDDLGRAVDDAVQRTRELRQTQAWAERARLEREARERDEQTYALAIAGLWPAFQPIVDGQGSKVVAYEALMRTTHAAIRSPPELLDLAKRLGRLDALEREMRERVVAAIPVAPPDVLFFINLHPEDLHDSSLFSPDSSLSRFASRVVLEITERASLDSIDALGQRVADLRKLGFRIAVDDLGSGYSGLTSLAELRPEFVKLDAALVRGIDADPVRQRLVAGITRLCHDQGAMVIGEGVETAGERDALVARESDWLQGYLFARPARLFTPPAANVASMAA